MKVGCVREIKNNEFRVGLTPDNVKSYAAAGHEVLIEAGAGLGSGFADAEYTAAGANACKIAVGMGADVTIIDISLRRLEYLDELYGSRIQTLVSNDANIERAVRDADLVVGSVLIPGAAAPKLFKKAYLKEMRPGAVFVDVAIDQGGCGESSHVTSHDDPIFIEDGIVHYCVGNMPGAVPRTSTIALTNATIRYGLQIAEAGLEDACRRNDVIYSAINTYDGKITYPGVAECYPEWESADIRDLIG